MNRENYINEVEKRLNRMFLASKDGYKAPSIERHRLEGFMNAGVFIGIITNDELSKLMDKIHFSVFGKTIQQRIIDLPDSWQEEITDYSQYDQPTYERKDV